MASFMPHGNEHQFPPNLDPTVFAFLACIVGAACCGDYDANEQNSIGNWFMLLGQFMITKAGQQALIEGRLDGNNININSKQAKNGGSYYTNGKSNQNQRPEVDFLIDAVIKLQKELQNIKNSE